MDSLLAKHLVNTSFDDLPPEAVQATRHHILHTLATVLAGSAAPGIEALLEVTAEQGGAGESTVLVHGMKLPAASAALVNSAMAHAQDYCMNDDRTFYKSSVVAVPVALAVAEKVGQVTGRDFLAAVCVGIDLGIRIALAINPKPAHALSPMLGGFAAAAAASRLLGLKEEQMLDALGISYCQVSASGSSSASPALTKRLVPGLAARAGVFSALLAKKGFTSARDILSGPRGYFCTYHGMEGDLQEVTFELGKRWEIVNVGPKGYPCCRVLHGPVEATLALVREHNLRPEEVERVTVHGSRKNLFMRPEAVTAEVLEIKRHPRGVVDAQFSIPWGVASAIVRGDVFIDNFTQEGIKDQAIHRMADRVHLVAERKLEVGSTWVSPTVVEIETRERGVFTKRVDYPKGNPKNPVSLEETKQNFRRCAAYAARPIPDDRIGEAIDMIDHLEDANNISRLAALLSA